MEGFGGKNGLLTYDSVVFGQVDGGEDISRGV